MESVNNPLVLSHSILPILSHCPKGHESCVDHSTEKLGRGTSSLSDKTYQWAYPTVLEGHSKLRLDWHCWANPDLALNTEGSYGMEAFFMLWEFADGRLYLLEPFHLCWLEELRTAWFFLPRV